MPAPRKKPSFSSTSKRDVPLPPAHSTPRPLGHDPSEQLEDEDLVDQTAAPVIGRLPARPEDPAEQLAPPTRPYSRTDDPAANPAPVPSASLPHRQTELPAPVKIDAPSSPAAGSAPAEAPASPAPPLRVPLKFGPAELGALGGFAVFGLVACVLFFKYLYKEDRTPKGEKPALSLSTPVNGQIATLTRAESNWRQRKPSDRGRADFTQLPELRLAVDPAQSKDGYLRIEIADSRGELQGDVIMLRLEGGKFKDTGRGEALADGGASVSVAGTEGFASEPALRWYLGNSDPRWTVRIQEGADYSKGPWTTLGYARIANEKL